MSEEQSFLNHITLNYLTAELEDETDEACALRKALLGLIWMIQEDAPEPIEQYISYLLALFPPLSNHFQDHKHSLFLDQDVLRIRDTEDNVILMMKQAFWEKLVLDLEALADEDLQEQDPECMEQEINQGRL